MQPYPQRVERSNGARMTACTFQADEKIQPGYAGMVEGYQRQIAALADAIVAALTSPAGGIDPAVPKIDRRIGRRLRLEKS